MNPRAQRRVLIAAALLLLALSYWYWSGHRSRMTPVSTPVIPATAPMPAPPVPVKPIPKPTPSPIVPKPVVPKPVPTPLPTPRPAQPPAPTGPVTAPMGPTPPKIALHPELIPKNIEIVRCYYDREIVAPETTFGFDINGSGFTSEFQSMIQVETGGLDIQVRNLRLVTANQIHGELVVGSAQTTEFIYPRVLIHGLPVFRAPDPFAVVRPGEVLVVVFISLELRNQMKNGRNSYRLRNFR